MTYHRPNPRAANHAALPSTIRGSGEMLGKLTGTGSGGVEAPDSLRSRQVAKIIDILGEGPVRGIVGWLKGVYFNGIPLQNSDGTYNYTDGAAMEVLGWPDNPVIPGFEAQEAEYGVSAQVKKAFPITKRISNTNVDRVRITVSTPSLQVKDDKDNINGSVIAYRIDVQNNGGGYISRGTFEIKGKTSSTYQRGTLLQLGRPGPWDIRVVRLTDDAPEDSETIQNDLFWETYTEIVDAKINYSHSHAVGLVIDAEQFGSIPSRTYLVDGRIIQIPSNYNPDTRAYTGVWNGTFKNDWTNNPAWILYDLITNWRYGLGSYLTTRDASGQIVSAHVDKWALYEIAKWCDQPVANGIGGFEPRFVCNVCINGRADALDVLTRIASVFRGFIYWSGGQLVAVADMPRVPSGIYSAANVIGGSFEYQGADRRTMHNMVIATWHDPTNLGETRMAIAEDQLSISKLGIQDKTLEATGATTQSQALRAAKWQMFTNNYEAEVVTFKVGLDGAWTKPGDVISIADKVVGGERRGGRVVAATQNAVTVDGPVTIKSGVTYRKLSVVIGDGKMVGEGVAQNEGTLTHNVETLDVSAVVKDAQGRTVINVIGSFSKAPRVGVPWVLATGDLMTTTWRVVSIDEDDDGSYRVTAMLHHPDKWNVIEKNAILAVPDISNINPVPPPITNLKIVEFDLPVGRGERRRHLPVVVDLAGPGLRRRCAARERQLDSPPGADHRDRDRGHRGLVGFSGDADLGGGAQGRHHQCPARGCRALRAAGSARGVSHRRFRHHRPVPLARHPRHRRARRRLLPASIPAPHRRRHSLGGRAGHHRVRSPATRPRAKPPIRQAPTCCAPTILRASPQRPSPSSSSTCPIRPTRGSPASARARHGRASRPTPRS